MSWIHTERDPGALPAAKRQRAGCGDVPGEEARPQSKRGRLRAIVLLLVQVAIVLHVWHWYRTGRSVSPLEPSEAGQTLTEGIVNAGFVLFVVAIASTLVLGRFFCGWACHVVALQDGCAWLLGKIGLRPKPVRSRVLAYVPLFVAVWMFVLPSVVQIAEGTLPQGLRVELTTEDYWARFPGPVVAVLTFLAVGGAAVWLLGSKGYCTYGCPYGAVFAFADRFAKGRIRVTDDCNGCGHCTAVCTSRVEVHREVRDFGNVVDAGCMKCLDCVSACPKDALYFGFAPKATAAAPSPRAAVAKERSARSHDFTGAEEFVMAAVFVGTLLFAYRGLYGVVPLLLASTLAVFAAIGTVAAWRLVSRRDFTVQHVVLRRDGRFTAGGGAAAVALLVGAAFTVHSAVVRYHDTAARSGAQALAAGFDQGLARATAAHLDWLVEYGLWHAPQIDLERGRLRRALGEPALAEPALAAAADRGDDPEPALFELLRAQLEQRAFDRASATLERLLDATRTSTASPSLLELARGLESQLGDARAISNAARVALLAGDREDAASRLERLRAEHPSDPRTAALARLLGE
ncbi:MAG: 4Fe-4S binding protein [Planctomycetota bacterium]